MNASKNRAAGTVLFHWAEAVIPVPGDTPENPTFVRIPAFSLTPGKVVAIKGESGCGKSYFLSALAGLTDPCVVDKKFHHFFPLLEMRNFEPVFTEFIYVPQFPAVRRELEIHRESLLLWRRVLENVGPSEQAALLGPNPDLEARFNFLAQGLKLWADGRLKKRIGELSGGQLKRFGLLLRLPFYAPILVLDEPDTGLDLERAENVINFLGSDEYRAAFNRPLPAILMVTHNESLRQLADETITFRKELGDVAQPVAPPPLKSGHGPTTRFAGEFSSNPIIRIETALNSICHRAARECQHHLNIFLRSFQDFSVLLLAPILIFSALMICELMNPLGGIPTGDQRFTKYAFFAIIASAWLGLQLYGKVMIADAIILKQEFSWIANLRGGWRRIERTHIIGVGLGLVLTVLVTSLLQAVLGAVIFFCQPFGLGSQNWSIFPFMFVPLFMACVYGGTLGIALGSAVSCWQLDIWRPRQKPSLTWVNLLVPVIMLFHILFSNVYTTGGGPGESSSGPQGRLIQCNLCSRLSGWLQNGFLAADPKLRHENGKFLKESAQACLCDGTLIVFAGWMAFFGLIFYFCFQRILRTPEVRRE